MLGMVARGDKKHDIAAWFGENPARVQEAMKGEYGTTQAAPADQLPPKGAPGPKGIRIRKAAGKALELLNTGDTASAKAVIEEAISRYDKHET